MAMSSDEFLVAVTLNDLERHNGRHFALFQRIRFHCSAQRVGRASPH